MTDGFCGLPQGSAASYEADRLGNSILSKVELPFFYSAIQRMKEEITDGTQELAGIQRWCVAE